MNVETGAFAAVTDQLMALAARVEALEARDAAREIAFRIICGAADDRPQPIELVYNAGGVSVRRRPGSGTGHAADTPRPRHLRALGSAR